MSRAALALSVLAGVVILAVLIAAPFWLRPYGIYLLSLWAVTSIAAIGLNLTLGYAGQVSLAQGAFVGIGAYVAALLTLNGWPLGSAYVLAFVLCFAIGWLLGYPALRVQHHYLAFVTLAFATLAYLVMRNEEWITGGIYGLSNIPRPNLFGYSLRTARDFYFFCLANLALIALATWWLIRSPWGRAFVALRENPVRALSLGVDTRRYTLMAFAIGAGLGGISGVLYAPLVQYIDPTPFALLLSLNLLLMVIVGGSGYFFGPFLGAVIAVLLPEWLQGVDNMYWVFGPAADFMRTILPSAALKYVAKHYLVAYAIFVMVLLVFSPGGILGFIDKRLAARRAAASSPPPSALEAKATP
jgi:branched-chain amino acid transport system permease protein